MVRENYVNIQHHKYKNSVWLNNFIPKSRYEQHKSHGLYKFLKGWVTRCTILFWKGQYREIVFYHSNQSRMRKKHLKKLVFWSKIDWKLAEKVINFFLPVHYSILYKLLLVFSLQTRSLLIENQQAARHFW
jgi:hypothetical protein